MQAACQLLADWQTGQRRILVTGDMLELGEESDAYHQHVGACAAKAGIDGLIAFGPHADRIVAGAIDAGFSRHGIATCQELDAVLAILDCWLDPQSTVLIKGSRGMKMERVVEWLRQKAGVEPGGQRHRKVA